MTTARLMLLPALPGRCPLVSCAPESPFRPDDLQLAPTPADTMCTSTLAPDLKPVPRRAAPRARRLTGAAPMRCLLGKRGVVRRGSPLVPPLVPTTPLLSPCPAPPRPRNRAAWLATCLDRRLGRCSAAPHTLSGCTRCGFARRDCSLISDADGTCTTKLPPSKLATEGRLWCCSCCCCCCERCCCCCCCSSSRGVALADVVAGPACSAEVSPQPQFSTGSMRAAAADSSWPVEVPPGAWCEEWLRVRG